MNDSVDFMDDSPVHRRVILRGGNLIISTSSPSLPQAASRVAECDMIINRIDSCIAKIDSFSYVKPLELPVVNRSSELSQSVGDLIKLINKVTTR